MKFASLLSQHRLPAFLRAVGAALLFCGVQIPAPAVAEPAVATLTNTQEVRRFFSFQEGSSSAVRLEGVVLWISPAQDQLVLQDEAGGIAVDINLRGQSVQPGDRIRIEGNCRPSRGGVVSEASIADDGIHSVGDKSATVSLGAGWHPISVEWFNGPLNAALSMDWSGPGFPREALPDAALFRWEAEGAGGRWVQGLDYRCYEGEWTRLPDFSQWPVSRRGTVANLDLSVRTRETDVGLVFSGYLKAPRAGVYTFWLRSDDGGKLTFGDQALRVTVLGKEAFPAPKRIVPGEPSQESDEGRWAEVEGVVTKLSVLPQGMSIEITSDMGRACLQLAEGDYDTVRLLLHSRIRASGIYRTAHTISGQPVPGLLVPDAKHLTVLEVAPARWDEHPILPIGSLAEISTGKEEIVHISGRVGPPSPDVPLSVQDDTGRIPVQTAQVPPNPGDDIEVLGFLAGGERGGPVVRNGLYRKILPPVGDVPDALPLLTKAIQVMSLSRAKAQLGYPVRVRGIVTARVGRDFFIQDSTWSVYAAWGAAAKETPEVGEFWEVEGRSHLGFAPDVQVDRATYLGPGTLPEPFRPSWDELINGSLATRYVEIQGIATAIGGNDLTLLVHAGKINLQLSGLEPKALEGLEGALIRVRGVGSPDRDENQKMLPRLRLFNASVTVDEPAPVHPFETPLKRASDLLFFDAHADTLRRIRIAGQVVHERGGEYFLMDGADGFRCKPKSPVQLSVGDLVEVVGFPDVSGPSPVLREAVVRMVGHAALPAPKRLPDDAMLSGKLDATLVRADARLVGLSTDRSERVLELQTGARNYVARLANKGGPPANLLPGSWLELTGVYAGQGGDRAASRDIDSFELLLNSPSDIRVLAQPSWWTVRRALAVIGGMVCVILVALVWITLLRRQVEERTRQLASEIKSREQAERQHALQEERARIAQDLHDDLGAALTEIRFLSAVKSRALSVPQAARSQLREVSEKSRLMVSSLDEIVWAVNPANDSLPSLGNYFCHAAEEFFRPTDVRCRLDVDESFPPLPLTSEVRHNLYLSVREAMNNVAKHARASEMWLRIHWRDRVLHISIEDNGCGLAGENSSRSVNGLTNMRRRIEKIGGSFECQAIPGSGTACRIIMPLA